VRSFRDGRTVGRRFVEVAHDGEPSCAIATATFHRPDAADPAHRQTWLRPRVRPLADEPWLHDCALLFLSDYTILWPTLTVHGLDPERHRHTATGSVAHTMWFHRQGRADTWLLYDQRAPASSGGLAHAEGRVFSRSGVLLASVTQVGLLRPPQD
jgi:acyl-CoA thioesterase-2